MKFRILIFLFIMLIPLRIVSQEESSDLLKDFLNDLYRSNAQEYLTARTDEFNDFCDRYGIDKQNIENIEKYLKLYFFHDLFTGVSAQNCSYAGAFKIRYFWHWVTPNPRYDILMLPGKKSLTEIKPPAGFSRYKSFASIDRVPSLFLGDLAKDSPKYSHPKCGDFYTFGWCSEREMAFSLLLSLYGYETKIKQEGIHVWSSFWVSFRGKDGEKINLVALVDNTFDILNWKDAHGLEKNAWAKDYGSGQSVGWYNRTVKSADEIKLVSGITVKESAKKRLERLVNEYFEGF